MHQFTALYAALDATTGTNAKVRALCAYYREAPPLDAAWATYFLSGRRLRRVVRTADLRGAALRLTGLPEWLFDASYDAVGDLAETIALLLPPPVRATPATLSWWVEERVASLANLDSEQVQERLVAAWAELERDERFVLGKLLTGAFRVGVGRELVHRALGEVAGVPPGDVAQRLTGPWQPSSLFWEHVRGDTAPERRAHQPYPFCLAHPLEAAPESLGSPDDWQVEWKWDGVRVQVVVRDGEVTLWSRGEELVSGQFPEIVAAARALPSGTVLDGEVVAWDVSHARPATFAALQRRIGRKDPSAKMLRDHPVRMLAYDVLEAGGTDVREVPLVRRRATLESIVVALPDSARWCIALPELLTERSWADLAVLRGAARAHAAEGLMLKLRDSRYAAGRARGHWWKWKMEPFNVDAVLVYAQPGSGRRASLYTDYTFAVWQNDALVPFAKAYSGLTDAELRQVDNWIRSHTLERFGPVRSVEPVQVFELAFEAIQASSRHKSGVAVRFPRIARWRKDKPAREADTLETLQALARSMVQ
ncbi:MAG: ATP-dependent DNA ligase [Pseudomonadota bacterium]|nr:ATP-dependent DNA ligase [Pseudomonadota bacterium]